MLRVLRPAEAAVRRLIIVAARGLVVPPPAPRPRRPKPAPTILRRPGGTGVWIRRGCRQPSRLASLPPHPPVHTGAEDGRAASAAGRDTTPGKACAACGAGLPRRPAFRLLDPPRRLPRPARPTQSLVPRIWVPGAAAPFALAERRPPSRHDPIDATRLRLRLEALAAALDDIPAQARRFARWRATREARDARGDSAPTAAPAACPPVFGQDRRGPETQPSPARRAGDPQRAPRHRNRRVWPLRTGRPPGQSRAERRRPSHEIQTILTDVHGLAFWALEAPDTS
ncbi:hypothetical protein [Nitratireductor sp. StC3]|uniref:hypothetical protein n=1 Tax=Nitratireductor sp. StC3 TaxID=2126741 RepID=UPI000D0CAD9B|nr:hypothetical protein [Nitratireductor sp. StC3]PSM19970.1 hypothetical protein C7T96_02590 [Nitratireductor sp. StC3]